MAKVKKDTKRLRYKQSLRSNELKDIKGKSTPWFENKIERIRSFSKPYAARAARYGALAGVAILLLITAYSFFLPKDRFEQAKERVLRNTNDFEAHLVLAEEFLKNNQLAEAEKELLLVQQIQSSNPSASLDSELDSRSSGQVRQSQVLGLSTKLEELWSQWREQNPEEIKKEIQKWEKIVAETPTYRDGWLYLALYYFKLGNREKVKENLDKALELDPSYEVGREIKGYLK